MNWSRQENQRLIEAIISLNSKGEAERFIRDLMTESEITEFAKRFWTAEMLTEKIPYSVIENVTGFSSTTVARVSKWLKGEQKGYKTIIDKLHHRSSVSAKRSLS